MILEGWLVASTLTILIVGASLMMIDLNHPAPIINGKPRYTLAKVDTYPLFYQPTFNVWDQNLQNYVTVKGSMTLDWFQLSIVGTLILWTIAYAAQNLMVKKSLENV